MADQPEEDEDGEQWAVPVDSDWINGARPRGSSEGLDTSCNTESSGDNSASDRECGHGRTIIQIDIDCFYAQVEMLRNPDLRNKPLGIQQKNIVVTCNYKARELGLTKLMYVKDAKAKCPGLTLVSGEDLTHYRAMSYKITEVLQQFSPAVERLGFDENFLDVTSLVESRIKVGERSAEVEGFVYTPRTQGETIEGGNPSPARCGCGCHLRLAVGSHIAASIRRALFTQLGITGCAGIAHNKLLAKLVGAVNKPNKQTTLFPEDARSFMTSLGDVRKIPGIGHSTVKRLEGLGVCSVADLQSCLPSTLEQEFEENFSARMIKLSLGVDETVVKATGQPQSISDEDSFRKCGSEAEVKEKILELVDSLLVRLLEDGRIPQTVRLTIRRFSTTNKYSSRESRQCPVLHHVFSGFSAGGCPRVKERLGDLLMSLFHKLVDVRAPFHLTLINVCFSKFGGNSKNTISSFFGQSCAKKLKRCDTPNADFRTELSEEEAVNSERRATPVSSGQMNMVSLGDQVCRKRLFSHFSEPSSEHGHKKSKCELISEDDKLAVQVAVDSNVNPIGTDLINNRNQRQTEVGDSVLRVPPGVDESVFSALPVDIQRELWNSHRAGLSRSPEADCSAFSHRALHCSSAETSIRLPGPLIRLPGPSTGLPGPSKEQQKLDRLCQLSVARASASKQNICNGRLKPVCNLPENTEPGTETVVNADEIPPHIDRTIFTSLPGDVQDELLLEWRQKSTCNSGAKNAKSTKKPFSGILKYYQKSPK